jgi:hypothetical protein
MAKKKKSLKGKGSYAAYKASDRQLKNQKAKRERHAKKHPNDLQSQQQAKSGYKRKVPVSKNQTQAKFKCYDGAGRLVAAPEFKPFWMLEQD